MKIILDDDVISLLKTSYSISNPRITPLGKETWQHVFKIVDGVETYTLRMYSDETSIDKIQKDISVLEFLERNKFPAPRVIGNSSKDKIFHSSNYHGYLATFIEGKIPDLNEDSARAIGVQLGRLHMLPISNKELPLSTWNVSEMHNYLLKQVEKFRNQDLEHNQILPLLLKAFSSLPDLASLPQVIIHTDIGPHNSIQTEQGEIVFIDWDDAGIGTAIIDVAYMLAQICISFEEEKLSEIKFDQTIAKAYLDGYTSVRPLSDEEKNHMIHAIQFCTLSYVFQEWIPKIDIFNWERFEYEQKHSNLFNELL